MEIGHIGLPVGDFAKSKTFYTAALIPLGLELSREKEDKAYFSFDERILFYIYAGKAPTVPLHIAFDADSKEQVNAFHAAALAASGRDNGAPGIREKYNPTYYAAFVLDPDGNNIEAISR